MAGHVLDNSTRRPTPSNSPAAAPLAGPSRQFEMQPITTPTSVLRRGNDDAGHDHDHDHDHDLGGDGSTPPRTRSRRCPMRQFYGLPPMILLAGYRGDPARHRRRRPPSSRVSPVTEDMIIERALPRTSNRYGLFQALARSVTLSVALAGLASALYLAARWRMKRGVAGVAIGANGIAIIIDAFMLIDLVNTKLPRVSPSAIGVLDFVMMAAALTAGIFVRLSDHGYEAYPSPWRHVMMVTAALTWATAGVRFIYVVWSFFDYRRIRETRRDMRNNTII